MNQQQRDRGRGHARNSAALSQCFGALLVQLLFDVVLDVDERLVEEKVNLTVVGVEELLQLECILA